MTFKIMVYAKNTTFKSAMAFDSRLLKVLMAKVAEQNQLLRIVRAALPLNIAEHVDACVLSGTRLLIYVGSAAWASQIRFYNQAILNKLSESGQYKITTIKVKVLLQPRGWETGRSARLPSPETVRALFGKLDENSDDVLDKALTKLGKTLWARLRS